MTTPEIITINDKSYYLFDDIYKFDTAYFGNLKRERDVIKLKKLTLNNNYILAYLKGNKWIISNENYNKAKILLDQQWVETNVPKMMTNKNNNIDELYDVPPAPELLDIDDNEKFKDKNGNIIEIEIRGERNHKNCYFKVKDVSDGFNLPNLQNIIIKENTNYNNDLHYKYFIVQEKNNILNNDNKKTLYLTYLGMLKVLFASRSGNAESFQEWATEKLFTVQLGSDDNKYELVKNMFGGVSINVIKEAFNASSGKTPCIYLFVLGNANQLLKTDKYSNDCLLYKYGYTDDLPRRSSEHNRNFKKIFKTNIELMIYSIIDPKYVSDAETSIKKYLEGNIIEYDNMTELVVLNKTDYERTNKMYKMIQNSYIGCYKEMQERINKLENELKEEQYRHDLTKKDLEYNKLISIEQQQSKDLIIENLNLKLKMAQSGIVFN